MQSAVSFLSLIYLFFAETVQKIMPWERWEPKQLNRLNLLFKGQLLISLLSQCRASALLSFRSNKHLDSVRKTSWIGFRKVWSPQKQLEIGLPSEKNNLFWSPLIRLKMWKSTNKHLMWHDMPHLVPKHQLLALYPGDWAAYISSSDFRLCCCKNYNRHRRSLPNKIGKCGS